MAAQRTSSDHSARPPSWVKNRAAASPRTAAAASRHRERRWIIDAPPCDESSESVFIARLLLFRLDDLAVGVDARLDLFLLGSGQEHLVVVHRFLAVLDVGDLFDD